MSDEMIKNILKRLEDLEDDMRQLKKKKRVVFKPPTIAEITEYCRKRRNSIDPIAFFNHYETNGWYRGTTKVKNWKSCIITWERSGGNGRQNNSLGPQNNIPSLDDQIKNQKKI